MMLDTALVARTSNLQCIIESLVEDHVFTIHSTRNAQYQTFGIITNDLLIVNQLACLIQFVQRRRPAPNWSELKISHPPILLGIVCCVC